MKYAAVVEALKPYLQQCLGPEKDICGIAYDSRQVEPGFVFVAIAGQQADGHDFIAQAADRGAALIIAQRRTKLPDNVGLLLVSDSRRALAVLSAAFYAYPDRRLRLIGVTGTNGKTTTTNLIKYLLERAGHKSGVVGTVGGLAGDKPLPELLSASTTPESLELYRLFGAMAEQGCDYAVIEASSHALDQGRVSACRFVGAVFTNLTQDHLDYHKTMEAYGQAKAGLFAMTDPWQGYGVVNVDDPHADYFTKACRSKLYTYGQSEGAELRLLHYSASMRGMDFSLSWAGNVYDLHIPLIGRFNIYNAMAAVATALAEGLAMEDVVKWLADAPQVPGRFELVDEGQPFAVVVDYAHTPDGLENVLKTARSLKPRRLIAVFGCGGNRDTTKRPIMGRLAGQYADVAVLTSDNPRFEDPQEIIAMVERGMREVCNNYLVEADRGRAVELAINLAQTGDIVLLAGKGHEDYQLIRGEKHHFDDREEARRVLRAKMSK